MFVYLSLSQTLLYISKIIKNILKSNEGNFRELFTNKFLLKQIPLKGLFMCPLWKLEKKEKVMRKKYSNEFKIIFFPLFKELLN